MNIEQSKFYEKMHEKGALEYEEIVKKVFPVIEDKMLISVTYALASLMAGFIGGCSYSERKDKNGDEFVKIFLQRLSECKIEENRINGK